MLLKKNNIVVDVNSYAQIDLKAAAGWHINASAEMMSFGNISHLVTLHRQLMKRDLDCKVLIHFCSRANLSEALLVTENNSQVNASKAQSALI